MRWLTVSCLALLSTTASIADDAVCETVAATIRARQGIAWSRMWHNAALFEGTPPIIEGPLNTQGSVIAEKAKDNFERALAEAFHPEPALAKAFHEFPGSSSYEMVSKVQNGTLHALWLSSGNDDCRLFVFFDVPKSGPARLLPDVDLPQDRECETDATIAGVNGRPVFMLTSGLPFRYDLFIELRALNSNRWDAPCTVHVASETLVEAEKAFLPKDGPIRPDIWRDIAPKILKAKLEAELAGKESEFHYGPKPAQVLPDLPTPNESFTLPLFGAVDGEMSQYVMSRYDHTLWPATIDGKPYALRIGHRMPKGIWVRGPDYFLIAYRVGPDGLEPVASASVSIKPGPFRSATVEKTAP